MFLFMTSLHENTFPQISEDLILRIAKDDTDALRILFEETHKSIYGFAYSILKNPEDASDIVQETFVKIHASASIYKCQGKPMAWILTIVKNLSLMKYRKNSRSVPMDISEGEGKLPHVEFTSHSDDKMAVQNALSYLPSEDRQIVVLHAVTGLKHKEIAEILNMPLSTVLSKYNRALKKMKKILEEDSNYER